LGKILVVGKTLQTQKPPQNPTPPTPNYNNRPYRKRCWEGQKRGKRSTQVKADSVLTALTPCKIAVSKIVGSLTDGGVGRLEDHRGELTNGRGGRKVGSGTRVDICKGGSPRGKKIRISTERLCLQ